MKRLGIGINEIDDEGAFILSKALHKIEILEIKMCKITNQGVESLAKSIAQTNDTVQ